MLYGPLLLTTYFLTFPQPEQAMPIEIKTPGIHHLGLRVSDLDRSKAFYIDTLGFKVALEVPELVIFFAGGTAIALRGPEGKVEDGDRFDPFRVGLDHLALGCDDPEELKRVAAALEANGIENTGIKRDPTLDKDYVAFKDPDRIAWEFYSV